jgi:hypothetical protein
MFQACLRNFVTEPGVCRRSVISHDEAVKMISNGKRSRIRDFLPYHVAPKATIAPTKLDLPAVGSNAHVLDASR